MLSFARTKIQPPRARPGALLPRGPLQDRLVGALTSMPLVLVCATAGFGKTSTLTQAIDQLPNGTAVAWIGCDSGDTPLQLFSCLVAALEPYDLPWRTEPESLIAAVTSGEDSPAARRKPLRALVTEVINALDTCDVAHGVIVVDDLHRVEHPAIHEFLDLLLERFTARWSLAIATRHEPPIALARLRARGQVADFRLDDLRFDRLQARTLGAAVGVDEAAADTLFERTQGWPAGLQLAFSVLRGAPGASLASSAPLIDRQVFDFLASEVIAGLDPDLREFLLLTSVLHELSAARCAALTSDPRAPEWLDQIERAGLFVTALPAPEPTLRLHDLFRDALEQRLLRERPHQLPELFKRAAATETDALRSVEWLLRAGAWAEAEAALNEIADDVIAAGGAAALRALHERFPPQRRNASARLQMLWARTLWDWDTVIDITERAARAFGEAGDDAMRLDALTHHCVALAGANRHPAAHDAIERLLAEPQLSGRARLRVQVAAAWIGIAHGDQRKLAPLWSRIVDALMQDRQLALWTACAPLPPTVGLPGMRMPLQRFVDVAQRLLPDQPTPLRGLCHVLQGWLHLWVGEVDAAQACAEVALEDNRWLARPPTLDSPARSLQAVLHAVRGKREALDMVLRQIEDVAGSGIALRAEVYLDLYRHLALRCATCLGDDSLRRAMAQSLVADVCGRSFVTPGQRRSALAHLSELDGRLQEACAHWTALLDDAHHADLYGQVSDASLRLADLLLRSGASLQQAAQALVPLFERVARDGEWGALLLSGPALLARLAAVDWGPTLTAAQVARLREWSLAAQRAAGVAAATAAPSPHDGEGLLSVRELEVLAQIAAGDSNKLIARTLDLSPHTVKRHVANILDKLDLRSRGQAAAWYHDRHG